MNIGISFGCLALFLASYSKEQNKFVQTTIEEKVETKMMVSRAIITNQIADTASQKRVVSYIVKDKQKGETKINNTMIENNKEILKKQTRLSLMGTMRGFSLFVLKTQNGYLWQTKLYREKKQYVNIWQKHTWSLQNLKLIT